MLFQQIVRNSCCRIDSRKNNIREEIRQLPRSLQEWLVRSMREQWVIEIIYSSRWSRENKNKIKTCKRKDKTWWSKNKWRKVLIQVKRRECKLGDYFCKNIKATCKNKLMIDQIKKFRIAKCIRLILYSIELCLSKSNLTHHN